MSLLHQFFLGSMIACTLTASAEGVKKEPVWAKVSAPPVVYSSENSDPTVIDYTYYKGDALDFTGYDGTHLQRAAVAVDPVALQGMKIKSIYAVGFPVSTDFGNPKFWISSELNNVHDILEKTSEMTDGRAVAELETSVDMPSTTFYVGYDLDVYADQGSFIPFSKGMPVAGTFYITYDDYGFSDYSSFFGPLTIGLILESEDGLNETSLLLSDYGATVTAHPGEPVTVTVNAPLLRIPVSGRYSRGEYFAGAVAPYADATSPSAGRVKVYPLLPAPAGVV